MYITKNTIFENVKLIQTKRYTYKTKEHFAYRILLINDETYSYEIVGDFIENNGEIILNTAVPSTAYETYGEA